MPTSFSRTSTVDWEHDVYARGLQLNRWPFSEVVSAVMRHTAGADRSRLRALEIGCGAGNNLVFLAGLGMDVHGIDLSATALEAARSRLAEQGHEGTLAVGDLERLSYPDETFDLVLDRGALTQNTLPVMASAVREAHRVLRPGGVLMSFELYGHEHPDRAYGREVARHAYDHFTGGYFARVGLTVFVTPEDVRDVFAPFDEVRVERTRRSAVAEDGTETLAADVFSVTAFR